MQQRWKKYKELAIDQWQQLSIPEKKWAVIGILLFLLLVYAGLIWYPLYSQINLMKSDMLKNRKMVTWMSYADETMTNLKKNAAKQQSPGNASALELISQASKTNTWGSFITTIKPTDDGLVSVMFNNISFDELMRAIEQLNQKDHVQVLKLDAQRVPATNMVQATVDFK